MFFYSSTWILSILLRLRVTIVSCFRHFKNWKCNIKSWVHIGWSELERSPILIVHLGWTRFKIWVLYEQSIISLYCFTKAIWQNGQVLKPYWGGGPETNQLVSVLFKDRFWTIVGAKASWWWRIYWSSYRKGISIQPIQRTFSLHVNGLGILEQILLIFQQSLLPILHLQNRIS